MNEQAPPRGGAAGMLLLFAAVALVAGLGFDFAFNNSRAFWIGAEHGGRAVLAVGAVAIVVAMARIVRMALGAREKGEARGRIDQP